MHVNRLLRQIRYLHFNHKIKQATNCSQVVPAWMIEEQRKHQVNV